MERQILTNNNLIIKNMEKAIIKIKNVFIPVPPDGEEGLPLPGIKGYKCITLQEVKIDGKLYDKFQYIPNYTNLCKGGNAKRIGDEIHYL